MSVTYKDIDTLSQKSTVAGTEKIPVSDTQYITSEQIATSKQVHLTDEGDMPASPDADTLYLIDDTSEIFVSTSAQSLTSTQKTQARTNIGAGTYSVPSGGIPASDIAYGVIPTVPTDIVKYTSQTLTTAQQAQARTNIGAASSADIPTTVASLTDASNYPKYVLLADEAAYTALATKDSGTLYLIPKV